MSFFQLWFSQGICPVVGVLGHMAVYFLFFKEPPYCLLDWSKSQGLAPEVGAACSLSLLSAMQGGEDMRGRLKTPS